MQKLLWLTGHARSRGPPSAVMGTAGNLPAMDTATAAGNAEKSMKLSDQRRAGEEYVKRPADPHLVGLLRLTLCRVVRKLGFNFHLICPLQKCTQNEVHFHHLFIIFCTSCYSLASRKELN